MRCNICYLPIHDKTGSEHCPRCLNDFHRDHFAAWLLDHEYCPVCRDPLSESFRESMRPKSETERRRLERILSTLDGIGEMFKELEGKEKKRIMQSRREEFGLDSTSVADYIKIIIPFVLLGLFFFLVLAALTT